uniref:hypothetical protein n=1 Tax=Alistipes sp. D31t1_170403_E11 TaxID=2787128 RepID=UPI001896B635|nr:hypothetical protein [Alistipes sp. D31t1_170403_E11]
MKKILFGVLIAFFAPFTLSAQSPIVVSKPMIQSFVSTAEITIPKTGGTFQIGFTMKDGWQNEYRDANGLRSFITQELAEDELFWLSLPSVAILPYANEGTMTFALTAYNNGSPRVVELQSATNSVIIRQATK